MDITIRARNRELSEVQRLAIEAKVNRLGRFLDGIERAEVLLSEERNPRILDSHLCEATVVAKSHVLRAKATAPDALGAVDQAMEKLEHRMVKLKGRLVSRSHPRRHPLTTASPPDDELDATEVGAPGAPAPGAPGAPGDPDSDSDNAVIVKTKQFAIKPMIPDEAALQMDLLGHDFFLFTNADTGRSAVVYRRHDGHIGLIDAA